jgi:hypothetical protein
MFACIMHAVRMRACMLCVYIVNFLCRCTHKISIWVSFEGKGGGCVAGTDSVAAVMSVCSVRLRC